MALVDEPLFCPYCAMMQFHVDPKEEETEHVYCPVCGVDIPIRELVRAP